MKNKIKFLYPHIYKFIESCPLSDNELITQNGVVKNDKLQCALSNFINEIEQNYDNITKNTFNYKNNLELKRLSENNSKSKKLLFFYQLSEDIYNVIATLNNPYPNNQDLYFKLAYNGIQQFRAITTLYLTGCDYSIIPLFRTLYENLIIFLFLAKHPELQSDFIDHIYVNYHKVQENSQSAATESKSDFDYAVDNHLEGFDKTYGWTAKVIKKKTDRKLEYMANEVGLSSYSTVYKLACNFVHSSSLAITVSVEKPEEDITNLFLEATIDLIVEHLITLAKKVSISNTSNIIILNILYHIKDEFMKS